MGTSIREPKTQCGNVACLGTPLQTCWESFSTFVGTNGTERIDPNPRLVHYVESGQLSTVERTQGVREGVGSGATYGTVNRSAFIVIERQFVTTGALASQ